MRCEREKRAEVKRMTSFERFMSETVNLVLNPLIYCKPVKRFEEISKQAKILVSEDQSDNTLYSSNINQHILATYDKKPTV